MARLILTTAILASACGGAAAQPEPHPHQQAIYGAARGIGALSTATPSPVPTSTPIPTATPVPLTGMDAWLAASPWPEYLWPEVSAVAWCESRHDPSASNGVSWGLMQVTPLWFDYAGIPFSSWADPVANLTVAWAAYNYDLERGYPAWTQWSCKP